MATRESHRNRSRAATPAIHRRTYFVFFAVLSGMAAVIAGLTAFILKASGMEIVTTTAATFAAALTLSMTGYVFLDQRSPDT
ncbi:hypothetical protein [Actinoplanes sp. HUAS TT8]|uniref:hypothetical protein n=1 Tax=Actinoplanes sp. HUAS TT8 TaxID=3447453 RepID=UPI003F520D9B